MSPVPTKIRFRCLDCECYEDRCHCEKYCSMCQSQLDVRLCGDGLYYCQPCRESCDYKTDGSPAPNSIR